MSSMRKPSAAVIMLAGVLAVVVASLAGMWLATRAGGDGGGGRVFPEVINPQGLASAQDLAEIQQAVHALGEQHLVQVVAVGADRAEVTVADGSPRARSGRRYQLSRTASGWQVDGRYTWSRAH